MSVSSGNRNQPSKGIPSSQKIFNGNHISGQRKNSSSSITKDQKNVSKIKQPELGAHQMGGLASEEAKLIKEFIPQKPTDEQKKERRNKDRLQHLSKLLPQKARWEGYLDVGCGNAEITSAISQSLDIDNIYGVDVFPEEDFQQPLQDRQIIYKQNISNQLDIKDSAVDLITCFMAIHHFEHLDQMMNEIRRVLALEGYLFIREHDVPQNDKVLHTYIEEMHRNYPDQPLDGFINLFNKEELRELLCKYGFEHLGDSFYTGTNPQAVYHSLYILKRKQEEKIQEDKALFLQEERQELEQKQEENKISKREKKRLKYQKDAIFCDEQLKMIDQKNEISSDNIKVEQINVKDNITLSKIDEISQTNGEDVYASILTVPSIVDALKTQKKQKQVTKEIQVEEEEEDLKPKKQKPHTIFDEDGFQIVVMKSKKKCYSDADTIKKEDQDGEMAKQIKKSCKYPSKK